MVLHRLPVSLGETSTGTMSASQVLSGVWKQFVAWVGEGEGR